MPTRTLKQLLAAMPIGMEMEPLEALLPEIFAAAQSGQEQPLEIATIFLEVIVRAADNRRRISPAAEQTMLAWIKSHWATIPARYFEKLCAILVNLKTDERGSSWKATGSGHRRRNQRASRL